MTQVLLNAIVTGASYTLVALGFGLIYRTAGFFHFAHGAVYAVGAYAAYALMVTGGLPLLVSQAGAVITAAAVGILIEYGVYRPLRGRAASSLTLLLVSLGLLIIIQHTIALVFGDGTLSLRRGEMLRSIELPGGLVTCVQVAMIGSALLTTAALAAFIYCTRLGRALRAVADDRELAWVCGVPTDHVIAAAMAIGSGLTAVGAVLAALDVDLTPTMGLNALLMGVVALIIGGVESLPAAAVGGLVVAFAQHGTAFYLSSQWQDAVTFSLLLLFLMLRPSGFAGRQVRKATV